MVIFEKKIAMIPVGCVEKCRGCKHREWSKTDSLAQKFSFLQSKLKPWVNIIEQVRSVDECNRWGYRDKTTLSTYFNGDSWEFGMWSRDELISIPACPIHSLRTNDILKIIRESIPKSSSFQLAFVVLSGAQIVLVIKSKGMPSTEWNSEILRSSLSGLGIEGFWIHLNPSTGKRIFEKNNWQLIWGKPRSVDYNGLIYGPAAFQQLLPELYNQSLNETVDFFEADKDSSVIDLYCGSGNSMKHWTKSGAQVIGVELGGDAVECAKINVPEATVLRGACRQRIPQIDEWATEQKSEKKRILLYANPPRTGLETEVLSWIINKGQPLKIAYLSCSPGTLSKNIDLLTLNGYSVSRLIPFDFFPQTIHVECLALLERKDL